MKSAIVTGAADGLGADVAQLLSENGYRVGVLDIREDLARETAGRLENAVALIADVSNAEQVAGAFSDFGQVPDLLVNNAGIVRFGPMEDQSIEDYLQVINVNLIGSCLCARQAAQLMLPRGSGHIINFTSINGIHPAPNVGMYGGTKAAMANLTQAMAVE